MAIDGRGIDLHAHTTASDGSLSPVELIELAAEKKLAALGVTDHDTLAALPEAAAAAQRCGVELVPGIELNVEHPGRFHLLGYLFRPDDAGFNARLRYLQDFRASRNVRMVDRMQQYGLPISLAEVEAEAGGDMIGRPHMALALIRKGIVQTVQEAFDRFLADGGPCDIPKEKVTPAEGIRLIRDAGGVPVVAHPVTLGLEADKLEVELRSLRETGLGGLECYYSQHTPEQEGMFLELARKLDLVPTGGSDFHGASKPHVHLGVVRNNGPVDYRALDELKRACTE